MEEKAKKLCGYIFAALVVVGLVLAIVGLCTGVISASFAGESDSLGLFADEWEMYKAADLSPTFSMIALIVTIVGAVVLAVDAILRVFMGKDLKIVRIIGVALAFIGAVLVLVAGLMLAGDFKDTTKMDIWSAGPGIWLGFIGGLVAAIGGGLPLLKAFN